MEIIFERKYAFANKNTFTIPPIKKLLKEEINTNHLWLDPCAGSAKFASITNDLNPIFGTTYNLEALEFLQTFPTNSIDGVIYDPPYSPREVKEFYESLGLSVPNEDRMSSFWTQHKNEISRILVSGGKVISFGWSSMGMGKSRGFRITRILMVPHGGSKNDTIVTVSVKR